MSLARSPGKLSTEAASDAAACLKSGVSRLLAEEDYAHDVQHKFSSHLQQHAQLDALARCKALNSFLAKNVRFAADARRHWTCCGAAPLSLLLFYIYARFADATSVPRLR